MVDTPTVDAPTDRMVQVASGRAPAADLGVLDLTHAQRVEIAVPVLPEEVVKEDGTKVEHWPPGVRTIIERQVQEWKDRHPKLTLCGRAVFFGERPDRSGKGTVRVIVVALYWFGPGMPVEPYQVETIPAGT